MERERELDRERERRKMSITNQKKTRRMDRKYNG